MAHVLCDLEEKSKRKELVWASRRNPQFPKEFVDLAQLHVPSVLTFFGNDTSYWLAYSEHLNKPEPPHYQWD